MKDLITRIKNELEIGLNNFDSVKRTVDSVYLFGSGVTPGAGKKQSDVDLAFLLDAAAYVADPVAAVAPAYLAAMNLGMSLDIETDVTILNAASLEIAYEVVTTGKCLLDNAPDKRMDYEIAIRGMYFDFKPFLEKLREGCIRNL